MIEGGLRKRLYHKTPGFDHKVMARLRRFTVNWCRTHLTQVEEIPSFYEWLDETNYSRRRKAQLTEIYEKSVPEDVFDAAVECHVKDEFYEGYKFLRMISSREDVAKCYLGPIFHSIEKIVYKLPFFVKGLTEQERIERIVEVFGERDVYVTDYSAFETHFVPMLVRNCEMVVYNYMLAAFPAAKSLLKVLIGTNRLRSKHFNGKLEGVRMSGEMNTSLGNGLSNIILMSFIASENSFTIKNALVEGDDGLFELDGNIPTPALFAQYGLELKIDKALPHTASFCGCVFNPVTKTNFGHPLKHLVAFGWCGRRHLSLSTRKQLELVMSRVYSFNALYPGVPLLWKVCQLCIRHIKKVPYVRCLKYMDRYKSGNITLTETVVEPCMADRMFFEDITGISMDLQLTIENVFERSYPRLDGELLRPFLPEWADNWDNYVSISDSL